MTTLASTGLCALMVAASTLAISHAGANDTSTANPSAAETHERPPINDDAYLQHSTLLNARHAGGFVLVLSKPFRSIFASDVIGSSLTFHQDREFGAITNFVFDEGGQILAVIVGSDGFLGMGEREIAIPWHDVERGLNVDGETTFQVDMTEEGLRNAPAYAPEYDGEEDGGFD